MRVSIIGTGYVGLTTGVCLGYLGHKVTCIDSDERKIGLLRAGKTPIYEPFLTELMAEAQSNLAFCGDYGSIKDAEVVFIAVGTPPSPDGSPGPAVSYGCAAQSIGQHYDGDFLVVVNKSTVPIGSGNWVGSLVRESYEQHHGKKANGQFSVASNPEFLREGYGAARQPVSGPGGDRFRQQPRAGGAVLAVSARFWIRPSRRRRICRGPREWARCR